MGAAPPKILMVRFIFFLFIILSTNALAEEDVKLVDALSVIEISQLFDLQYFQKLDTLPDLVRKAEIINKCVNEYILKQSKSYYRIVQNNLYDMIHNFDKILPRINGKKVEKDSITHAEKIEALAKLQCDVYYSINILK